MKEKLEEDLRNPKGIILLLGYSLKQCLYIFKAHVVQQDSDEAHPSRRVPLDWLEGDIRTHEWYDTDMTTSDTRPRQQAKVPERPTAKRPSKYALVPPMQLAGPASIR